MSLSPTSVTMTGKRGGKRISSRPIEAPRKPTWSSYLRINRIKNWLYPHESIDDLLNPVFYRDVFVECVLCAYVMACVIWALMTLHVHAYSPNTTHFGLFAGFIIMLLIEAYGPISGAPINPAGCWGFFIAGRISLARTVLYTGVEIGGCAAGSTAAFYLSPVENQRNFTAIKPGPGLIPVNGMFIEAILTFNLLFVALIVTDPKRKTSIMPSLPIAWCIGTGIFAALYWAGPYIGATFGSLFYLTVIYIKDHYERHPPPPNVEHPGIQSRENPIATCDIGGTNRGWKSIPDPRRRNRGVPTSTWGGGSKAGYNQVISLMSVLVENPAHTEHHEDDTTL